VKAIDSDGGELVIKLKGANNVAGLVLITREIPLVNTSSSPYRHPMIVKPIRLDDLGETPQNY
jgi:hypothetical protein